MSIKRKIKVAYESLDWSKPDSFIAKMHGVSRARIGQIRKQLGKLIPQRKKITMPEQTDNGQHNLALPVEANISDLVGEPEAQPTPINPASPAPDAPQLGAINSKPDNSGAQNVGTKSEPTESSQPEPDKPDFADVEVDPEPPKPKSVDYGTLAGMCFDISVNTMATTFGQEWLPRQNVMANMPSERDVVVNALATYMQAHEVKDIPPGLMLTIVVVAYAAPRLNHTNTKTKLYGAWLWIKSKFTRKG